jgi:hypothetical protein
MCLDRTNNLISFILTQKQKINYTSYHHYSPKPSGGLRATEEGTYDASKSEAVRTRVQRASTSSSVRSALCLDCSTSSSVFNYEKYDSAATNAEHDC